MELILISALSIVVWSVDTLWNGSKMAELMPEIYYIVWLMAVFLAWAPPIFEFYSRGDKFVRNVAKSIATVSVVINLVSGYATIEDKTTGQSNDYQQRLELKQRLDKDYSDAKMDWCFKAPASVCKYKEKSEEKKALEAQIDALSHARVESIDHSAEILGYLLLFGLATLPFAGVCCGRLLSRIVKLRPTVNNLYVEPTEPEPKTVNEIFPEPPGASRSLPEEIEIPPKVAKKVKKSSEEKYRPTDEEAERLGESFRSMIKRGEKITKKGLAIAAGVRERVAAYWVDNTDMETKMEGANFTPGMPQLVKG